MHAELLKQAFDQAQRDTGSEKVLRRAQFLSDTIEERTKQPYGERSLRNYFNEVQQGSDDFELPAHVVDGLAGYLGYDTYRDFLNSLEGGSPLTINRPRRNTRVWYYLAGVGVIALVLWVLFENPFQTKMMIWVEDHYEVVPMDLETYKLSDLKKINQDRLDHFRKVEPDCSYEFFDGNKLELLWYGRNPDGELEYFTDLGRHPETGKTLDPITEYMIKKYICPTYPNN
ncbi:hypothetical protein [Robiginitalea biformata]|uniref:Uncharacterized protein n=1 Tax=Robiginitalea biformata (strain ATCC BAA-864 / DSM 15991 / KCTC 12146 / HTCC2501) TaxID=313596 RepID=A4CHQ9_ROBBH|nr:hypothetical protein [Robiginitalea biformata]EAR16467.1 hypothetical protein RB2501_06195 [Robiginitalea biformata HTCC2501]